MFVATEWFEEQRANDYPALTRGDVFISMYHGGLISPLIAKLQGRNGSIPDWSHVGIYVGDGKIAEATYPNGGVRPLKNYMQPSYTCELYSVENLSVQQRAMVASEAVRMAPNPYDTAKFVRHLIDNVFERWTWNDERQRGFRPLAMLFRKLDKDKDARNVCSELVERAYAYAGVHMTEGETGTARPYDVWYWFHYTRGMLPFFAHERGVVKIPE